MIPTLLVALIGVVSANETLLSLRMSNVPLQIVLSDYAEKAGKTVEMTDDLAKHIRGTFFTIQSDRPLTIYEYMDLIETELKEVNVGLFQISSNRLVATWIKVPKSQTRTMNPRQTEYQVHRDRKLKEMREHQMHLIRQGKTPLPIPLTKEMDDQLVKEGILPPVNSSTNSQYNTK